MIEFCQWDWKAFPWYTWISVATEKAKAPGGESPSAFDGRSILAWRAASSIEIETQATSILSSAFQKVNSFLAVAMSRSKYAATTGCPPQ